MIQAKYLPVALALGVSVAVGAIAPNPAAAVAVTFIQSGDIPPTGWTNLGWTIEGRAGVKGSADWEFGAKGDEASNPVEELNLDWANGQDVPWLLNWNGSTVAFTLNGTTIDYTPPSTSNPFTGFYLWARTTTEPGKVDPGTSILFQVNQVNGSSISPVASSSTAPASDASSLTNITKNYFLSDTSIASLSGIARISWLPGTLNPNQAAARSRVGLKIEGFSTPTTPTPTPVPEPASILGLLTAGILGTGSMFKRKA